MYLYILSLIALACAQEYPAVDHTDIPSRAHHEYTKDTSLLVWPWRSYKTSPHNPPHMKVNHYAGPKMSDGYIFISPVNANNEDGTYGLTGTGYIFDHFGDLVFAAFEDSMGFCDAWVAGMTDFRPQEYQGKRYITYWNGCNHKGEHWGHRWGRVSFLDEEYEKFMINPDLGILKFDESSIGQIGNHEHQMTDRNTMVITVYNNTLQSLASIGGPEDAWVADGMFMEIDIKTGEVLFEWRALDHLDMKDSRFGYKTPGAGITKRVPWDWFHINSVQKVGDNYLISSRHHWAIYLISGKDGSQIWKLDGITGGDFGSIPETFRWQHHARAFNVTDAGMTVSLFNNMVNGKKTSKFQTQGLAFWLPMPASPDNPPVLVKRLQTPSHMLFSGTQGSYQMDLGNGEEFGKGNGFIGYGLAPYVREYGPANDGSQLLWQAQFGEEKAVMSYRGFKAEWRGTPKNWDPVALFEDTRGLVQHVYVSWNGATDITGWAVFAGKNEESLAAVGVAKKKAFETVFELAKHKCVRLGAIRDGEIIRMSNVACIDDESSLPGSDISTGEPIYSQQDYDDLKAQKKLLEAEKEELEAQKAELEGETWAAYRLFAEVALAVILIVAGGWIFVLWRDWRRRRQYGAVSHDDSGPFGLGLRLPRWQQSRNKTSLRDRNAAAAADYDESRLDDLTPRSDREKAVDSDHFGLTEDEDDEPSNSREPFIK